jgi:hypothetical protein
MQVTLLMTVFNIILLGGLVFVTVLVIRVLLKYLKSKDAQQKER